MAIRKLLGADAARVKVSSTKSMTGHLLGAAGAVEAVASALAVREDLIRQPSTCARPTRTAISTMCRTRHPLAGQAALSNSLGFGGHNGTLCFRKVV